jgi:hypothetical protein
MHAEKRSVLLAASLVALSLALSWTSTGRASPFLIIGNDEKVVWDDEGKPVLSPPGKDSVVIVDLAKPEEPKIIVSLPLENTITGPPVNMAFSPKGDIALVANSIDVVQDGGALKQVPDDRIYVIDMKADPPKLAATIKGGKQPSGLSISPSGNMALVANREDKSITVLSINGTDVKVTDTIPMGDSVAHVAIAPDGKRALAVRPADLAASQQSCDGAGAEGARLQAKPIHIAPLSTAVKTAQFVESGGAEIGMISYSLALAPRLRDQGRIWEVPTEAYPRREQGGVILSWAQDRAAAETFRDFVLGQGGRAILRRHGFRQARDGQNTKMELIYRYLTGPNFRHRVEAIVERFSEMQADLDKERRAMTRLWAKREAQIQGVIESTVGM